jgi:hypothetical protein
MGLLKALTNLFCLACQAFSNGPCMLMDIVGGELGRSPNLNLEDQSCSSGVSKSTEALVINIELKGRSRRRRCRNDIYDGYGVRAIHNPDACCMINQSPD